MRAATHSRYIACLLAVALLAPAAARGLLVFRCASGSFQLKCCCPDASDSSQPETAVQDAAPSGCSVLDVPGLADEQAPQPPPSTTAAAPAVAAAFLAASQPATAALDSRIADDAPPPRVPLLIAHCTLLI